MFRAYIRRRAYRAQGIDGSGHRGFRVYTAKNMWVLGHRGLRVKCTAGISCSRYVGAMYRV